MLWTGVVSQKDGVKRIIAETGAGQHGVATATACALFGIDCVIYMGEEDTKTGVKRLSYGIIRG